jgi:hypothetical protein
MRNDEQVYSSSLSWSMACRCNFDFSPRFAEQILLPSASDNRNLETEQVLGPTLETPQEQISCFPLRQQSQCSSTMAASELMIHSQFRHNTHPWLNSVHSSAALSLVISPDKSGSNSTPSLTQAFLKLAIKSAML